MATTIFLDLQTELENKLFSVIIEDSYDPSGIRDKQFFNRNVEPLFKPTYGSVAHSRVTIKVIIDMLFKEVGFAFDSDDELIEAHDLLNRYFMEINKLDTAKLQPYSEEKLFLDKCRSAFAKITELKDNRKKYLNKLNPNKKKSIFDIISKMYTSDDVA